MTDPVKKLNGFGIRSWADIASLSTLLLILAAIVTSFFSSRSDIAQLQVQINTMNAQIGEINTTIKAGVLPVTAERLGTNRTMIERNLQDIDKAEKKLTELERRLSELKPKN